MYTQTHPRIAGVKLVVVSDREAAYEAALRLVARIDEDLTRDVVHYRTKAGKLLTTLDEVVRAILANDLVNNA